jgi:phosphatidylethanolamine/phosphatidyl-N-methylethanolamine N-methyltransferase
MLSGTSPGAAMRGQAQQQAIDQRREFWRSWIRDPRKIGAIAPSSRVLAALMARGLTSGARVLELGAGTGSVTSAILAAGIHPQDLCVVEQNRDFLPLLRNRFPQVRLLQADATALEQWGHELGPPVDFVISSLPLVLFSPAQRAAAVRGALSVLAPEGQLHQFTYLGRCPIERSLRHELGLSVRLLGVVPLNLPPAVVYRLQRQ